MAVWWSSCEAMVEVGVARAGGGGGGGAAAAPVVVEVVLLR